MKLGAWMGTVALVVIIGVGVVGVATWRARHRNPAASLTVEIDADHPFDDGLTPADALARTIEALRARADKFDLQGIADGHRFTVEVPADAPRARVAALMTRPARIAFRAVDDGSDYMKKVAPMFDSPRDGVGVGSDYWTDRASGTPHEDLYLRADDLATVRGAFARISKELPSPPDRTLAFEERPRDGDQKGTEWRSYLVEKYGSITSHSVRTAEVSRDAQTGRPEIKFELNFEGRLQMEALTERCIGKKIVIELDGRVLVAPVVESKIGGRGIISLDSLRHSTEEDAEVLAALLPVAPLEAPVRLVRD